MQSKSELRGQLKAKRAAMPIHEVVEKSQLITTALQTILEKLTFSSLHCYEPIARLHEVDVSELFDMPDVALYTSRQLDGDWHVVSVNDDIAKADAQLDVIIVPMLGFDAKLQRIGYGGGYYDRLLAAHPRALRIGVCYEQGRLEQVPAGPHDMSLNIIVTEATALIAV